MLELTNSTVLSLLGSLVTARAEKFVNDVLTDVNDRMDFHRAIEAGGATASGQREYTYESTPGSARQSFGAFFKSATDTLADAARTARKSPDDWVAQLRLATALTVYQLAGNAFADIIVPSAAAGDRLDRPVLDERRHKQARALRAEDLPEGLRGAVLDATSGDAERIARATARLRHTIATVDGSEMQVAAAILGLVGDPFNSSKLNRLAEQIEKHRWAERQAGAPKDRNSHPRSAPTTATAARATPVGSDQDRPPALPSEILAQGGEHARRVNAPFAPAGLAPDFYGND